MPRKSAEAQWAETFRALNAPPAPRRPKPPAVLSGRAKEYWQEIVAEKPPQYFDAANRVMLECLCFHLHIADAVWPELEKLDLANTKDLRRYRQLSVMMCRQSALVSQLMTKLRLLPTKYMAEQALQGEAKGPARILPWEPIA